MNKTRLINTTSTSRMISKVELHKPTDDLEAERLVMPRATTKLAAKATPTSAPAPVVGHYRSEWGDPSKADRRKRDVAAARGEARREGQALQPIKPLFG